MVRIDGVATTSFCAAAGMAIIAKRIRIPRNCQYLTVLRLIPLTSEGDIGAGGYKNLPIR
jgi:hypothetical protein